MAIPVLSPTPKCWGYRCEPSHLALRLFVECFRVQIMSPKLASGRVEEGGIVEIRIGVPSMEEH